MSNYVVVKWEKCWVEYEFLVTADSPEQALELVNEGQYDQAEFGNIEGTGEEDSEHISVRKLAE